LASLKALVELFGILFEATPKSEPSAVPVYSGAASILPDLRALNWTFSSPRLSCFLDRVAGRRQTLGEDLAEHFLLGEVLRADHDGRLLVGGVGGDRAAPAAAVVVVAACRDGERRGERREHGAEPPRRSHAIPSCFS